jgi:benzodiazapine receptor
VPTAPDSVWTLAAFIIIVAAVATLASRFQPRDWYAALRKPAWNPPNGVFAPVWTVLYVLIAVAGWMIFTEPGAAAAKALWIAQLVLNGAWSWLFFGRKAIRWALVDVIALAGTIAALLVLAYPFAPVAVWLLAPYLVWVLFATSLNAGIAVLNRDAH